MGQESEEETSPKVASKNEGGDRRITSDES
jgi:hypothetical protein